MRPEIPDYLEQKLESQIEGFTDDDGETMALYELGNKTKSEFVRQAVANEIERRCEKLDVEEPNVRGK